MKIGLVNPWVNAAESQAAVAISLVASRLGHEAAICSNTEEALAAGPDFILSMSRTVAKTTHIPTYGLIHDPRYYYLEAADYLRNFFTYDGYFTLSDKLREFTADLLHSVHREAEIGAFYCATAAAVDWPDEPAFEHARLAYFGINWDRRHEELFRLLGRNDWMEVYGPPRGWEFLGTTTYKGMAPFDGVANLRAYHAAGAGLCLMSDQHLADDSISSRIFEVTAAGAVPIAPHMAWLKNNYGDTVLYVDQSASHRELAAQIEAHMAWVHSHPKEAREKAREANELFRQHYSMDVLLPKVLRYHEEHMQRLAAQKASGPLISVLLSCSEPDATKRVLESLAGQDHSSLEVILCPSGFDTGGLLDQLKLPFVPVVIAAGRKASNALWQGLQRCTGDYVCVIDQDCELLPHHFSTLLETLNNTGEPGLACAGTITKCLTPFITEQGQQEETRRLEFFPLGPEELSHHSSDLPLQAMLFHRDLLDAWLLRDPEMESAWQRYLLLALQERATPAFSYRPTLVQYEREAPAVLLDEAEERRLSEDEARLHLRLFGRLSRFGKSIDFDDLRGLEVIQHKRLRRSPDLVEYLLSAYVAGSFEAESKWQAERLELRREFVHLRGTSRHAGDSLLPIAVTPPVEPWAFGLQLQVPYPEDRPYVLRVHCRVLSGIAGIGITNERGDDFIYRVFVPRQETSVVVNLPAVRPSEVGYLVIQAGDGHDPVEVCLTKLELFAGTSVEQAPALRVVRPTVRSVITPLVERLHVAGIAVKAYQGVQKLPRMTLWPLKAAVWLARGVAGRVVGLLPLMRQALRVLLPLAVVVVSGAIVVQAGLETRAAAEAFLMLAGPLLAAAYLFEYQLRRG